MEVTLVRDPDLPPGAATLPGAGPGTGAITLSLGCSRAEVNPLARAEAGEVRLAPDVWRRLSVPYNGLRMALRRLGPSEVELGPVVAALWVGSVDEWWQADAEEEAELSFGHLHGAAGLFALAFAASIDWVRGVMTGYVLDNRRGAERAVRVARFPIPAAVWLTWYIPDDVTAQLRERTGERTFNWVRNMDKWDFYTLLAEQPGIRECLPETRLLRDRSDLAQMLARHGSVIVKSVQGIQGRRTARLRPAAAGFEVRHSNGYRALRARYGDLDGALRRLRRVVGGGKAIVQQAIPIRGLKGRVLDFRVMVARSPAGQWHCLFADAHVTPDRRMAFVSWPYGAVVQDLEHSLQRHYGVSKRQANQLAAQMVDLCQQAARLLDSAYDPLGLLGFDVAVQPGSHRLWLFEANTVTAWKGYSLRRRQQLRRSQIDYALLLAGYPRLEWVSEAGISQGDPVRGA